MCQVWRCGSATTPCGAAAVVLIKDSVKYGGVALQFICWRCYAFDLERFSETHRQQETVHLLTATTLRSIKRSLTYFVVTKGLVGAPHVRQCHPQGFQFVAAGQQFSLQLVLLSLDSLRLRLQAGKLHWKQKSQRAAYSLCSENNHCSINRRMLRLLKENDSVLSFNLSIVIYDKTGFLNRGYTKIKGEMNHKLTV